MTASRITPLEHQVAAALGLLVGHRLPGGVYGAVAVHSRSGRPMVLKVLPIERATQVRRAVELAARLRHRGVPVPDPYEAGSEAGCAFTLQARCDGEVPSHFEETHAARLVEFWEQHLHAAPEGSDWPQAVIDALTVGDPDLWADHVPVRAARGGAAAILDEIIAVGLAAHPAMLRSSDVVHGDWHHRNLLINRDRVTAVFDWEAARAGDARYDLVYLEFWANVYDGTEIAPGAAARLRASTAERVDADARRLLAALVALHQLSFVAAFRADRLAQMTGRVEEHLAPWWRT